MSNVFKTTKLADHRVLVQGIAAGEQTILDGSLLDEISEHQAALSAAEMFDDQVTNFFAPLTQAAEAADAAVKSACTHHDPRFRLLLNEGVKAVEGVPDEVIDLDLDTVILLNIYAGRTNELIWVNGKIELLAYTEPQSRDLTEEETALVQEEVQNFASNLAEAIGNMQAVKGQVAVDVNVEAEVEVETDAGDES